MAEGKRVDAGGEAILAGVPLRRQVFFAALLLCVALLLAEAVFRLVVGLRGDLPPTPDESLRYEWKWAKHRLAQGAPRESTAQSLTFDPDLGWRPTPGYDRDGQRINAQGLRAEHEFAPGAQPGLRRLALLGDSFTYGDHVANDQTFAHFLETEELDGWQVLNFAVNGYGTDQALLAWELHGRELAADVVVMGFYMGDYERNVQRFKIYAKPVFQVVDGALRLTHHPVVPPERLYEAYASGRRRVGDVRRPYLVLAVAEALERLRKKHPSESDPEWKVLALLMRRFADRVRAQGAQPVWMVLPYREAITDPDSPELRTGELCRREAEALGLPFLSLAPAFREHAARHPEVDPFRPRELGGHLSEAGHRLVARRLAAFLASLGLLHEDADRLEIPSE